MLTSATFRVETTGLIHGQSISAIDKTAGNGLETLETETVKNNISCYKLVTLTGLAFLLHYQLRYLQELLGRSNADQITTSARQQYWFYNSNDIIGHVDSLCLVFWLCFHFLFWPS